VSIFFRAPRRMAPDPSAVAEEEEEDEGLRRSLRGLADRLAALTHRLDAFKRDTPALEGFDRYHRAVRAEAKFVGAMLTGAKEPTRSRILSSNVALLEGTCDVLCAETGVLGLGQAFALDGKPRALVVDVVAESGSKWVKVKAMNGRSIEDVHEGRGRYGERSVVDLAVDYARCASQNIVNFGAPRVEFAFTDLDSIPPSILQQVRAAGVLVRSPTGSVPDAPLAALPAPVPVPPLEDDAADDEEVPYGFILPPRGIGTAVDPRRVTTVNLDVTALVALTSELTHGGCTRSFPRNPVLQFQADDEKRRPVLAGLREFLEGKELLVCDRAATDFRAILDIVAGDAERERGRALLDRCRRVPDQPSPAAAGLPKTRRIKDRQKIIFGTGDSLHAITLTANVCFVRAAEEHGVHFTVFTHPSRALTEQKGEWPPGSCPGT